MLHKVLNNFIKIKALIFKPFNNMTAVY